MKFIIIALCVLLLSSCAPVPRVRFPSLPLIPEDRAASMNASWYGEQFHGRPTSSGERYDMYGLTAAHKTMKFGSKLRVTNPDNNLSTVVIVNDRGPFIYGRDLDLSYGAAKAIGLVEKGVGRVNIEYLERDMRYVKRIPFESSKESISGGVTVQLGSFTEESNAFRLKQGLEITYKDVYITTVILNGTKYYRVRIGSFNDYDSAYAFAGKLADEGYSTFITSIE